MSLRMTTFRRDPTIPRQRFRMAATRQAATPFVFMATASASSTLGFGIVGVGMIAVIPTPRLPTAVESARSVA